MDIEELSVKTRVLIEWSHTLESIEISDDEKLLIVCAKNEENKEACLYVFSIETIINLASITLEATIDRIHLIASGKAERLLYISGKQCILMDPYNFEKQVHVSNLFERNQIQEQYIIRSDKIIYTIDREMFIEELVPDNWVEYLRSVLKDTNSITVPSKKTIEIITTIIENNNYNADNKEFEGKFLKWGLEIEYKSVRLIVIDSSYDERLSVLYFSDDENDWNPNDSKRILDILPSFYLDGKNFILHCEILENDDLIMITRIGVIIWTCKLSNIKMHYSWNTWDGRLEDFVFDPEKFKDLVIFFKYCASERILPSSSYETIYKNLNIKFGKEKKQLFKMFLEDNIVEEFYLTCYGKLS